MNLHTELMSHNTERTVMDLNDIKTAVRQTALASLPRMDGLELRIEIAHISALITYYGKVDIISNAQYDQLISILGSARRTLVERSRMAPTTRKVVDCVKNANETPF